MLQQQLGEALARRRQLGIADLIEKQLLKSLSHSSPPAEKILPLNERITLLQKAHRATGLPIPLINAVVEQESGWNPFAVSPKGARGLMQLMEETRLDLGVKNVLDPEENILAGSRYLKDLWDQFGNLSLALAAYNAGPGQVIKYKGIPPFKETQDYVKKILASLSEEDKLNQ
ncbi:MAG: lytic transglycosylase domain-containing protein [Calditrichaeota bacterium]|nr:MAG: lytic transglycosylase domain-containing protein [Calditrichota bacterium]